VPELVSAPRCARVPRRRASSEQDRKQLAIIGLLATYSKGLTGTLPGPSRDCGSAVWRRDDRRAPSSPSAAGNTASLSLSARTFRRWWSSRRRGLGRDRAGLPSKRLRPVRLAAGASASQSATDRSTPPTLARDGLDASATWVRSGLNG
jgi:hypothetical protein